MSDPTVIKHGQTIEKDPADEVVLWFDWTDRLLQDSAALSSFVITISGGDTGGSAPVTVLTYDNHGLVTGNKMVKARYKAGTVGQTYKVTCRVLTNESPAQTFERSFFLEMKEL